MIEHKLNQVLLVTRIEDEAKSQSTKMLVEKTQRVKRLRVVAITVAIVIVIVIAVAIANANASAVAVAIAIAVAVAIAVLQYRVIQ